MRLLPLLLALACLAPSAAAQGPWCGAVGALCMTTTSLAIAPPMEPVPPSGGFLVVPITIEYTYSPATMTMTSTAIRLAVTQAPPWAVTTVSPSMVYAPVQLMPSCVCQQVAYLSSFLLLSATTDAPAFVQGVVEVTATASGNGNLQGSQGAAEVPVLAAYQGLVQMSAPSAVRLRPGDGEVVPLTVTSFSNALTRVTFRVAGAPAGVQVIPPSDVTLQSRQQGGAKNSINVAFGLGARQGYEAGPVVLEAMPVYALNPEVTGTPARLVVEVGPAAGSGVQAQTLGATGAPSPLTFGLLAAGIACTVLLERHRRRRKA